MKISVITIILCSIVTVGFLLRVSFLDQYPHGLHRDEAFLGYNAYSLLETGRDMAGNVLPVHLRSFLYSPAGYSYFSIPFIMLFDLNVFSVRFASAIFGSLTIVITYFFVRELFADYRFKYSLGLLSSFLLAINPWHINLSRTATENVPVVFFVTLGVFVLLKWNVTGKYLYLIFGFISFLITIFLYQAPRAFLPIFIPLFAIYLFNKLEKKRLVVFASAFFLVIILPLVFILSSNDLSLRIRTVSIFSTQGTQLMLDQYIREDGVSGVLPIITRVFHNKIFGYLNIFFQNYFSHFTYNFLFTDAGFPDRYRVPAVGLLYIIELPLIVLGIWKIVGLNIKLALFLLGWIILVPVGSALTFDDVPNLQRTLIIFPALSIVSGLGIISLYEAVQKKIRRFRRISLAILITIFAMQLIFYLHQYYFHAIKYRPWYRQDGYRQLVQKVNNQIKDYKYAVITNRESAPTIFFLFFDKYDPEKFQQETSSIIMHDFDRVSFGKYKFSEEECPLGIKNIDGVEKLVGERGVLYVNSWLCKKEDGAKIIDVIERSDSSDVFQIAVQE